MRRDSQKSKLYTAERDVFHGLNGKFPIEFDTIKEAQAFTNKTTRSPLWKKLGGRAFVHARQINRNNQYARGWINGIELPPWAMGRPVILHELSHGLNGTLGNGVEHHGPEFVFLYRKLIEQEYGDDMRRQFDLAAEARGVRWNPSDRILKRLS